MPDLDCSGFVRKKVKNQVQELSITAIPFEMDLTEGEDVNRFQAGDEVFEELSASSRGGFVEYVSIPKNGQSQHLKIEENLK